MTPEELAEATQKALDMRAEIEKAPPINYREELMRIAQFAHVKGDQKAVSLEMVPMFALMLLPHTHEELINMLEVIHGAWHDLRDQLDRITAERIAHETLFKAAGETKH